MTTVAPEVAERSSTARAMVRSVVRVAIVGGTASGKSAVALAAAARVADIDLISVDAMQVYRGMDIGTAKPSRAEQAMVTHHLIDLVDHCETFTLADYQAALHATTAALATVDRRAIAVGGTGLYLRSVVDGLNLPGQWPELRQELESTADLANLYSRLVELDPSAADRTEPTNRRRIVRALEVCIGSGMPFSSFGSGLDVYPNDGIVQLGLRWSRERVAERIEQRVLTMVADGLVAEIEALRRTGTSSPTAHQALGYGEFGSYVDGACSLDQAIADTVLHTRQFAVRQDRWFRRDPRIVWIDIDDDPVAECLPTLTRLIER